VVPRAVVAFLILAAVWTFGLPGRVTLDERPAPGARGEHADPEAWADARGVPEPFDGPSEHTHFEIDPAPHRGAIGRVEDVLYKRSPTAYGDAEAVENGVRRLADDLMRAEGLLGRQAGLVLLGFAARTGARASTGYALPSLVDLREEWETVRASVFRPADWMRTAGPGLDRIQDPPPPPMDPRTDAVLAEAEGELRRLMLRGERRVERLGEPVYDPDVPGRSDGGQIRAWYAFAEAWREEIVAIMAPVRALDPAPDFGREPLRAEAVRALEEASEMLRRVPDGAGMWPTPFRPAWEARFRAANGALARARDQMARAGAAFEPTRETVRWDR